MRDSDLSTRERFEVFREPLFLTDSMYDEIFQSILDEESQYGCGFVMVFTNTYPQIYVFLRQDKFRDVIILDRCYVPYSPGRFNPDEREFRFIYSKLFESPEFLGLVERLSGEGLELRDVYTSTTFYESAII